jgi:hypothetical protein
MQDPFARHGIGTIGESISHTAARVEQLVHIRAVFGAGRGVVHFESLPKVWQKASVRHVGVRRTATILVARNARHIPFRAAAKLQSIDSFALFVADAHPVR